MELVPVSIIAQTTTLILIMIILIILDLVEVVTIVTLNQKENVGLFPDSGAIPLVFETGMRVNISNNVMTIRR